MKAIKLFQTLIIAMLVCMVASLLAALFEPGPPDEITDWFLENGSGLIQPAFDSDSLAGLIVMLAFCVAWLIAWVAALIGMMKFRRWSRKLFIAVSLLGFLCVPLFGMTWSTPLEGLFSSLTLSFQGAVLVLLFVEPVSGEFARLRQPHD